MRPCFGLGGCNHRADSAFDAWKLKRSPRDGAMRWRYAVFSELSESDTRFWICKNIVLRARPLSKTYMGYEFSLTLVNFKIMSLERVSVQKNECATPTGLGLYTNLDPQKRCIRTALGASPMSTSACHLGHFFRKTQVSEKLGPPLPSISSHRISFPVVHFTQLFT